MDGLSVAASVIGVTAVALHSIRELTDFIRKLSDAPSAIQAVRKELEAIEAVLRTIESIFNDQGVSDVPKVLINNTQLMLIVENCGEACKEFKDTITHWMRHSTEARVFWWDRVRTGYFGEAKTNAFTAKLETCKSTLSIALEIVTLCVPSG
ncbi:hypothetical protein BDV27DRAFT_139231 [Aspergillus caelatus]|uniref:Azaphilone pigments biosynthesis cluster protein L N-terminal domain-containing protein n=1 Tax=Aspergillus caelatus TaxID=61420 RepID=A0A5N6ZMW0_9EURO|nr:uncharacterized protein BDV27DRAFT_139231 [Aspergillus caelatus]KAE8357500.1 hypothetical protein BDV27DRAFT_139231 [Aspergillus caelatus]